MPPVKPKAFDQTERLVPPKDSSLRGFVPVASERTDFAFPWGIGERIRKWRPGSGVFVRWGPFVLLRTGCFISIALGTLSLLSIITGQSGGALRSVTVSPNDALGLIFMGFAVRMSRLEVHRLTMKIIVRTSRLCLFVLGVASVAGLGVVEFIPTAPLTQGARGTGLATGICYLLIGAHLILKRSVFENRIHSTMTVLVWSYLGSCWISLLLSKVQLLSTPEVLRIEVLPLAVISAIWIGLAFASRIPRMMRVFSKGGPEAQAARLLFPFAFVIPLVLAVLRHRAESMALLNADLGLLLHVMFSAGSMMLMIIWNANRISAASRLRDSAQMGVEEAELHYREILSVMRDPAWIFSAEGDLLFQNAASQSLYPTENMLAGDSNGGRWVLGLAQQRAILSAAILGRHLTNITLYEGCSEKGRQFDVTFLRALPSPPILPRVIILVARASRSADLVVAHGLKAASRTGP